MEEIIENYGLAKLIDEVVDDKQLSVHEAESLYRSLKQNVEREKIISGIKNVQNMFLMSEKIETYKNMGSDAPRHRTKHKQGNQ